MASKPRTINFREEAKLLEEGFGVDGIEIDPLDVDGEKIPALDYNTTIEHMRRHGYDLTVSPNGGTEDVEGTRYSTTLALSHRDDGVVELTFFMDVDQVEGAGSKIGDRTAYVEKPYRQIIEELVEREIKLEKAANNYVKGVLGRKNHPEEKIEREFDMLGDSVGEITENYFGSMSPTDIMMCYALQFEPGVRETQGGKISGMRGKMPLGDALHDGEILDRNALYLKRYMSKVIEKAGEEYDISDSLRESWLDIQ